jgi:nuclear cap-binding protein subunit 1
MRARAAAEVILAELQSFRQEISPEKASSFVPSDDDAMGLKMKDAAEVELVICDVVIQVVLHLGSRSFSHFLNVVERYHGLLRQLSSSPAMRLAILASTVRFWAKSAQWTLIVVDKWLQYRIVEPTDIVEFAFASPTTYPTVLTGDTDSAAGRDWSSFMWWELIRLTVHKVHGRVNQVRRRLDVLQREEYEREAREEIARESAAADGQSQQDTPSKPSLFPAGATASTLPRRPDLPPAEAKAEAGEGTAADKKQTAEELKASLENIVKEERKVLIHTLTGFVKRLSDVPEAIWRRNGQDVNDQHGWQSWWLKEWYVEYCRLFSKELKAHHETILANAMSDVDQGSPIRDTFERACQMAME